MSKQNQTSVQKSAALDLEIMANAIDLSHRTLRCRMRCLTRDAAAGISTDAAAAGSTGPRLPFAIMNKAEQKSLRSPA